MTAIISEKQTTEDEKNELLCALDRKGKEFIVLHEVAQIATESLDLEEVLNYALDKVSELMAPETAAIILADENNERFMNVNLGGITPAFLDMLKGDGVTSKVVLSPVPLIIEDISKYPQLASKELMQAGLRSIAAFPLKSGGRVIGTLVIASQGLHSFTAEDIQLLSIIAEGLGPALKSAQLHEALRKKTLQLAMQNRELLKQHQELLGKTREAEDANRLKSEFLTRLSHKLRTPLNVITGFSELMVDEVSGPINSEQRQCLDDILLSGRHLLHLIDEITDISKIETGRLEYCRRQTAAYEID